ncbi:glycosyltransferase family 2 protein [Virgibacillus necropolis]|uniref:Beta-1,4-galactosyltransferase n=1 Tax=Virgibacillus necropolis TaxID=163877 RepID=A0A221MEG1_9BACI|nr:glycosyltransferase family 2 protein [Virgibacillus necropolis]ASN05990.1 beta-1,4-galactosyltransferase [Virgibacillus necropolis]
MLQKEKVSVVVPIYKVEKYIHRCVDSILNQTYPNIEVILVDDGSPDNCGIIADHYGKLDDRVKVLHKKNGGLSDARNHGMKHVTGEFTVFVDSDDWLENKMIENMVNSSYTYKADIVQSAFYYAYDQKLLIDNRHQKKNESFALLDNKTLMYELVINERVKNFAWGKLYKTEMIQDIQFEQGVLFEDVLWAHQVMKKVNRFVLLDKPMYNYFQREDSIVATYIPRNLDIIKGLKERHRFIEEFYEELIDESYKVILKTCLIHYNLLLINRGQDKGGMYRGEIQSYIQTNYIALKEAANGDKQLSNQLQLFMLHPYFNVFFLGLRKGLRKSRILSQPVGLERVKQYD